MNLFDKLKESVSEEMLSTMTEEVKKQAKEIDLSDIGSMASKLIEELIAKVKDGSIDINDLVNKAKDLMKNVDSEDVKSAVSKLGDLAKNFLDKE